MFTGTFLEKAAIRLGYYSDKYFMRTQEILLKDNKNDIMEYQFFPRKDCILSGMTHVFSFLYDCIGYYSDYNKAKTIFSDIMINLREINMVNYFENFLKMKNLYEELDELWIQKTEEVEVYFLPKEGFDIKDKEIILGFIGNPAYFAHLETPILGCLSQGSAVATSVNRIKKILDSDKNRKHEIFFFPARFRYHGSQCIDGTSAITGGVKSFSTDANGSLFNIEGMGTIPHLLIGSYNGNTYEAYKAFDNNIDPSVNRIVLVDWDNDCIETTLEIIYNELSDIVENKKNIYLYELSCIENYNYIISNKTKLEHFQFQCPEFYDNYIDSLIGEGKNKLYGVRFDTSGNLWDNSVNKIIGNTGVSPELVFKAREIFDSLGLKNLKIIISGGFTEERIKNFINLGVPFDDVGIGSSIVNNFNVDFTADGVMLNGKPCAKIGRKKGDWSKLTKMYW